MLLRSWLSLGLLVILSAACSSSHATAVTDPGSALKAAARRSTASPSATFRGAMNDYAKPRVSLSGAVDFAGRKDSITLVPVRGAGTYPPYEVRFVNGWSYVEIDRSVRRPPTLRATTTWIAFRGYVRVLPVPDRSIPPEILIDVMNLPLTQPMVNPQFIDPPGSNPRRVSVRFARGSYSAEAFTYSIDTDGEIVAFSGNDVASGGGRPGFALTFTYGSGRGNIVAPSSGVQTLKPGENLYPTPTTTPTS